MKKTRSRVWRCLQGALWVIPLFFLTQLAPNVSAQGKAGDATLTGTVLDPSGAVVPGASVTLANLDRGLDLRFATAADGRYSFTFLPPAEGYRLKVEVAGFRPYVQNGIALSVGQTASLDVKLEVGQTTAEVVVSANATLLATEDANVGSDVNERGIVQLPLSTRNLISLLSLNSNVQPGVNLQQVPGLGSLADQDISFLNFGGQRFGTTAYLVDGVYDTGGDWGGVIFTPSVEETAEFRVQTNSYSAQYGWSTGNVVNMITKSGTRSLHGDGFWFLRNEDLEANSFFNNLNGIARPEYRQNQFGGTLGGPVYIPGVYKQREKTFFFFSFERINRTTPVSLTATLPLDSWKSGNFSDLLGSQVGTDAEGRPILSGEIYNPFTTRYVTAGETDSVTGLKVTATGYIRDPFPGNIIPQTLWDPIAKKLLTYFPQAQTQALFNNFAISGTETAYTMPIDTRIDHNITDNTRIYGKFDWKAVNFNDPPAFFGASNPAGPSNGHPNNRLLGALNFVDTLSPTSTISANIGIARWVEGRTPQGAGFLPSELGFPSSLDVAGNFPQVTFTGATNNIYPLANAANGNGATDRWPRDNRSAGVDYNKVHGSHSISAGFNYIDVHMNALDGDQATFTFNTAGTAGPNPLASTAETGFNFASFLLGVGTGGSGNVPQLTQAATSRAFLGGYVQDDWKFNRKLTLNLGLRYEVQTSPTERYNQQAWFDYSATNPISSMTAPGAGQTVAQLLGRPVTGEEVYAGVNGRGRGLFTTPINNFAPRIGLAYAATNRLVVRAGAAIFYVPNFVMPGSGYSAPGFSSNTPWVTTQNNGAIPANLLSNAFSSGLVQAAGASAGSMVDVGYGATEGYAHNRPTPYTEQWSFGLQYQLSGNNIIDVEYIGNHGLKLPVASLNTDQASPAILQQYQGQLYNQVANPFYGVITQSGCGLNQPQVPLYQLLVPEPQYCGVTESQAEVASSWYDALQVEFQHRWSNGLQMMASFTWSKYLDNSAGVQGWTNWAAESIRNPYDLAAEKSYDTNDIPLSFVTNFVYDLPVGKGRQFGKDMSPVLNAVAGGWQFSGILSLKEGFPLSVQDWDTSGTIGAFGGAFRPDVTCNPSVSNHTWNNWVNGACFAQPSSWSSFGDAPRTMGYLRGPGFGQLDLALHKNWIFRERLTTEFRAEAFNATNHTNFFAPGGGALDWGPGSNSSNGFGWISNAYPARDVQLALKLLW